MAKARAGTTELDELKAENERLRSENARLYRAAMPEPDAQHHFWRRFGAILFAALAVALLIAGNLLFWAGNTVVKNDRFTEAVSPVIRKPAVQHALANYTTNQIYKNVDVQTVVQDALPQKAQFLAPTITDQVHSHTEEALDKVLASPKFQDTWNEVLSKAHARFIDTVKRFGGDGTININELYQRLSDSLKDTKLSFLANKQLPDKVGTIQVVSNSQIKTLHDVIVHIDAWRILAILLFLLCAALAIFLARRRRRAVVMLALYSAGGMFVTLVALRVTREVIAGKVAAQYAEAARETAQAVFHSLVVQTTTIMIAFILVAVVAWLTGSGQRARYIQGRVQLLFAGKLHQALFGEHENAVTRWIGHYKRYLEWIIVAIVAVLMLMTSLTLSALIVYVVITIVAVLLVELLGASTRPVPDARRG